MWLGPITYVPALYVATHMRDWDRREIYATRWNEDPEELAADCEQVGHFGWIASSPQRPVAVLGAVPMHPGVWSVFMFATTDFSNFSISLTKFVKSVMIPALAAAGAHRAECLSMEGHLEAHRWLEFLGAKPEGDMQYEYGKNGENFIRFVWRRKDVTP